MCCCARSLRPQAPTIPLRKDMLQQSEEKRELPGYLVATCNQTKKRFCDSFKELSQDRSTWLSCSWEVRPNITSYRLTKTFCSCAIGWGQGTSSASVSLSRWAFTAAAAVFGRWLLLSQKLLTHFRKTHSLLGPIFFSHTSIFFTVAFYTCVHGRLWLLTRFSPFEWLKTFAKRANLQNRSESHRRPASSKSKSIKMFWSCQRASRLRYLAVVSWSHLLSRQCNQMPRLLI